MPPPAASTATAVGLSAGAAILEDPGPAAGAAAAVCICIYRRLCSGRGDTLISIYSTWLRWFFVLLVFDTCIKFSFSHHSKFNLYCSCLCLFLVIFRSYFVCTYSCMGAASAMYEVLLLFYCCTLHICGLLFFVKLDGCKHEHNYTTDSSNPGFA